MSTGNRNLIVAGIIVFIALLAWFFVVQPKRQQEAATLEAIAALQTQYDSLKQVADQKPLYLALQERFSQRLTAVEPVADSRVFVPSYLKQIEDQAKRDGLNVMLVTPLATPAPSPSPSASPGVNAGAQSVANAVPAIGAAARVAGAESAANIQAAQSAGAPTPAPGASGPAASGGGAATGASLKAAGPVTARQKAIAYLLGTRTPVPINMEFDGTYNDLQRFLRDLNKFPKLLFVGDVTLAPSSNTGVGAVPRLHITLPVVLYRQSGPNTSRQPAPGATPAPGTQGG